jgi:hypothetical protein
MHSNARCRRHLHFPFHRFHPFFFILLFLLLPRYTGHLRHRCASGRIRCFTPPCCCTLSDSFILRTNKRESSGFCLSFGRKNETLFRLIPNRLPMKKTRATPLGRTGTKKKTVFVFLPLRVESKPLVDAGDRHARFRIRTQHLLQHMYIGVSESRKEVSDDGSKLVRR